MRSRAIAGAALLAWVLTAWTAQPVATQSASGQAATQPPSESPPVHWAYRPVTRPGMPAVRQQEWVRTPVDAFVLAKLEERGLRPSPDTDRQTFIRRATLDAWGLIPTPEEVKAFVDDRSSNSYERLVDRLLASPRYGERQARRWLDLARYADSSGFENDRTRPNNWRYRDYVIDAFNQDVPFDQFIREQIAGDELAPKDSRSLIATGFLAGYPDNSNSRDLLQRRYQITTDMTDTVGTVFLAQTVGCARCHNHKFDRISQKEYFQLQAFFANTSEVTDIPAPVGTHEIAYRQAQAAYQEATRDVRARRTALLDRFRAETVLYQKERYLTDSRERLFKPKSDWTPVDRWVNHRWENVTRGTDYDLDRYLRETAEQHFERTGHKDEAKLAALDEYRKLGEALSAFNRLKPSRGSDTLTAMTELGSSEAPPTHLLFVGDHDRPLEEVQPGFPTAIARGEHPVIVPSATSSGRRTALANWIASPTNPLTARVFVNRVWAQYFGRGIVASVSNFGRAGQKPSHPELLDYLADRFVAGGWRVKPLHREILLSSVYRQASGPRDDAAAPDPDNVLLAVFPRQRLDAEQVRDSLLVAAGVLTDTVGGPSVFPQVPKSLDAGDLWQASADTKENTRRSLYVFTRRSVPFPLLETFNMASPQQVHSVREVTTTPLQALALVNSEQVFGWSQALAGRVIREAGRDESARLDRLYQILFARRPDAQERAELTAFLHSHSGVIASKGSSGTLTIALPVGAGQAATTNPVRESAFVDLVHTLANSNEFIYRF